MSAADSLATSETISDPVDDEALESVDDEVAVDALETLDDELDESSAVSRLVRSVSSVDSRLLALDELSVELEEVELLALVDAGRRTRRRAGADRRRRQGRRPKRCWPKNSGCCAVGREAAELRQETQQRRRQPDRGRCVGQRDRAARRADAEVDALVVDVSEELL